MTTSQRIEAMAQALEKIRRLAVYGLRHHDAPLLVTMQAIEDLAFQALKVSVDGVTSEEAARSILHGLTADAFKPGGCTAHGRVACGTCVVRGSR
jgi:hypothetical protein